MTRLTRFTRPLAALATLATVAAGAATAAAGTPAHVKIPDVKGKSIPQAYTLLHRLGFKVSLPAMVVDAGSPASTAISTSPAAATSVTRGGVVKIKVQCAQCVDGSPSLPIKPRSFTVENFVGKSISAAAKWGADHQLGVIVSLAPLTAGGAGSWLGNYTITSEKPAAGKKIKQLSNLQLSARQNHYG